MDDQEILGVFQSLKLSKKTERDEILSLKKAYRDLKKKKNQASIIVDNVSG
jgi:hypothetical protein